MTRQGVMRVNFMIAFNTYYFVNIAFLQNKHILRYVPLSFNKKNHENQILI